MWWDGLVRVLRIFAGAWVAIIAIVAALQAGGMVPELPKLEPYAWVISLAIIGVDSIGSLFANKVRRSKASQKSRTEKALMGLVLNLSIQRVLRFEELSASVFVPTRWSRFLRVLLRRAPDHIHLTKYKQFRPGGFPAQSGIRFTPGKGVVGECWRTKKFVHKDLDAVAERWGSVELSAEAFEKVKVSTRQGFSLGEFHTVVGKYREIAAEPIWHPTKDGKLVGILTLDRPRSETAEEFRPRLGSEETQQQLVAIAKLVGDILHTGSAQQ
jgi:hypothetical protein